MTSGAFCPIGKYETTGGKVLEKEEAEAAAHLESIIERRISNAMNRAKKKAELTA